MRVRSVWIGSSAGQWCAAATASSARPKRSANSSISASPMMSGGAMRIVESFAAFTMRPARIASAATAVATGSVSATPMSRPRPRVPATSGEPRPSTRSRICAAAQGGVLDEPGALDLAEHGVRDRGGERVAAERRAVLALRVERGGAAERDEAADREPAADALRDGDRVGGDARVLEGEPLAGASGAGLDLVDDEQRAVPVGELARGLEEPVGQLDDAGLALDGLDEERRDGVVEGVLERLDRGGDVLDAAGQRLERLAHVRLAGERERAHRAAVEAVDEREHAGAGAARVVEPRELERGLVRLGAGVAEPGPAVVARPGEARDALGELERGLGREVVGHVREPGRLRGDRLDEHGVRVAERVHRDAGEEVEVLVPGVVPDAGAPAVVELRQRHPHRLHDAPVESALPLVQVRPCRSCRHDLRSDAGLREDLEQDRVRHRGRR